MKLKEIAIVKTGLILSRKMSADYEKSYKYRQLTLKAVDNSGLIDINNLNCYYAREKLSSNYITQKDDVIMKLVEPYTAFCIQEKNAGLVIPSHFIIIRIDKNKAIPEYIAWYLNRENIKKYFRMSCAGTLMQIKPTIVANADIKLPDIKKQMEVVRICKSSEKELMLYEKLINEKKAYYTMMLNKINEMR